MDQPLLRFLQASDFQLHQPLTGLAAVPESLQELLRDAPLRAAERVFETALVEGVDFVVLAGNVIDPRWADARSLSLLQEYLRMLDQQGIAVYWAGGRSDRVERWPQALELPDGVHLFSADEVEQLSHFRDDRPLANILGVSWKERTGFRLGQFRPESRQAFNLAIGHGTFDAQRVVEGIHYWAMGGAAQRRTPRLRQGVVHYAGAPQGLRPEDTEAGGCTLVDVGADFQPQLRRVPTASLNWRCEAVPVAGPVTRTHLQKLLGDRAEALQVEMSETPVLVTWRLEASQQGTADESLLAELADWLRAEFGRESPLVWTVALDWRPASDWSSLEDGQDNLLADYLRAVQDLAGSDDWSELLTHGLPADLAEVLRPPAADEDPLLRCRAAELGVRLMSG